MNNKRESKTDRVQGYAKTQKQSVQNGFGVLFKGLKNEIIKET